MNQDDIDKRRKYVIGSDTYKLLFKTDEDPIGGYVKINGVIFKCWGL